MTVKKLYVVGSGAMGSGIAQTAATHGIQVIMNDINEEFVAKGYNKIKKSLEKAVTKGRMPFTSSGKSVSRNAVAFNPLYCDGFQTPPNQECTLFPKYPQVHTKKNSPMNASTFKILFLPMTSRRKIA